MADEQKRMAEEQRLTNFRLTILTTAHELEEGDRVAYLIEQLMPSVVQRYDREKRSTLTLISILERYKFLGFLGASTAAERHLSEVRHCKNTLRSLLEKIDEAELAGKDIKFGCLMILAVIFFFGTLAPISEAFNPKSGVATQDNTVAMSFLGLVFGVPLIFFVMRIRKKRKTAAKLAESLIKLKSDNKLYSERLPKLEAEWPEIRGKLIVEYFVSENGRRLFAEDFRQVIMTLWIECVKMEQGFLPASMRPSDEQWAECLMATVEPEAERLKRMQTELGQILGRGLAPDYERGSYTLVGAKGG